MKNPDKYDASTILVADDEPEHLVWLLDYINAKGFNTKVVTNVADAITASEAARYRAYVIDLNIPLAGWRPTIEAPPTPYEMYKGLYIIKYVRSQGNASARVVAYSAHRNDDILTEIAKLYCKYIVKGRPRELKAEVDNILKHDPISEKAVAGGNAFDEEVSNARTPRKRD